MTESLITDFVSDVEGRVSKILEKIIPRDKRYAPFLPWVDTQSIPLTGLTVCRLAGPTRGSFWYVRKIRVTPIPPNLTGVNGTIESTFSGGNSVTTTVPINTTWTPLSISFVYNTSVAVGNRNVTVIIKDPSGRIIYQVVSPFSPGASLATQFSLAPGLQATANGSPTIVTMPLPAGLSLPAGSQITVTAQNPDAADTITNGVIELAQTGVRADIFVCPDDLRNIPTLAQMPIAAWRDQLPNLPQVQSYGLGELKIGPQETLWAVISATPALFQTNFIASCEAYQYPEADENIEWII